MAEAFTALPDPIFAMLRNESLVLLATIDYETGAPCVNAMSWAYAVNPTKIRFALDQRSRIVQNLKNNALATMTVIGAGGVYSVYGSVTIVTDSLDGVPFKMVCADLNIESVRNSMFFGGRITVAPEYEKTYDKRAADRLDGQVFAAMQKA